LLKEFSCTLCTHITVNQVTQWSTAWEDNIHLVSQETSLLLWNMNVHCCVHKSPLLAPILSQIHVVHTF